MTKEQLIRECNALGISDLPGGTDLDRLPGHFINLDFPLPNGQVVKLWNDNKEYRGNRLEKAGSTRCCGLAADDEHILVCEYGDGGSDAEIVVFERT